MPVHSCQEDGKPGWQWGGHGKCYTYEQGNPESSKRAHDEASAQGQAAHAHGYTGGDLDSLSNTLDNLSIALDQLKKNLL
jgi:hypothetical protein